MKQQVVDDPTIARSKFFSPVTYTTCMVVLGFLAMLAAFSRWTSEDPFKFGVHFLFYIACMCVAVTSTDAAYHSAQLRAAGLSPALVLAIATCTLFMANTF